jgi:hypothetical protein
MWVCSNFLGQLTLAYIGFITLPFTVKYIVGRQDPSDPSTFPPPIELPPIPTAKITPNGENGHGTKSTGTTDRTKYGGLPLV